MNPDFFRGKKVTVMGLGLHGGGLGTAKWLLKHGAQVTVTDAKDEQALAPSVRALKAYEKKLRSLEAHKLISLKLRLVLGRHDEADFSGADVVIQNPGVPRENRYLAVAKAAGVPIMSDISIFFELCPFPIMAVTGTKGKTTTTMLLADICRRHDKRTVVGGNIRINPLDSLDKLLSLATRHPASQHISISAPPIVLELSSWQLESLVPSRRSPHIAVVTNVQEDHLNRYDNLAHYAWAKELILTHQDVGDVAILNADDARVRAMASADRGQIKWFSTKNLRGGDGCFARDGRLVCREGERERAVLTLADLRLPGRHNIANVLAATAAALAADIPLKTIRSAIRAFRGAPGRLETVTVKRGVRYVNDTTATTPDAAIAALRALSPPSGRKIVLIAGGADKKLRFDDWAREVQRRIKTLVLFGGTATAKMELSLSSAKSRVPVSSAASMKDAVKIATAAAAKGDTVLLSPGCASFGLFVHEFDRGEKFVLAVRKL